MSRSKRRTKHAPGPSAKTLKLAGPWTDGVKRALVKKRPKRGWPKHDKRRRK